MSNRYAFLLRRLVSRAIAALGAVVGLPLYVLSGFVPRRPGEVVIGANGDRFTDNARYLFLALADDDRFRCTWITGSATVRDRVRGLGLRAELRWSIPGVIAAVRADWFVYGAYPSDVNFWLSRGARLLNLWHGVPLKAIEFDIDSGPLGRLYRSRPWSPLRLAFLDRFVRPDVVVSPSRFLTERCFKSAFRVDADRCLEVGYPRTDQLFAPADRPAIAERLDLSAEIDAATEVVGYFPTWRDDGRDFLGDAGFSFSDLNEHLARSGRFLLFKAHPNFGDLVPRGRNWSNVAVLDPSVDVNEILPLCDILVTDYSSVAFDFLLLDRPIIYFLPDHDRYVDRRNLYFALTEMTAGPVVVSPAELYETLARDVDDVGPEQRSALRQQVWGDYSGDACRQLAELLARSA